MICLIVKAPLLRTNAVQSNKLYESAAESVLLMKCLVTEIFVDVICTVHKTFHIQAGSAPLEAQRQIPLSPEAQM